MKRKLHLHAAKGVSLPKSRCANSRKKCTSVDVPALPPNARLLPVAGAKPRIRTMFNDPNLVDTVIQPLP
jgi:hypothetical protein